MDSAYVLRALTELMGLAQDVRQDKSTTLYFLDVCRLVQQTNIFSTTGVYV